MKQPRLSAPRAVRWITRRLEAAGFETWAVGGAVRDALLGLPGGDWDLATRARPEQVMRLFRRTVPLGVEHGTVGVLSDEGVLFEVTTFRKDVETNGRHAVVAFADTVEEDLARRDFTINAVAWHPIRKNLLDPYGGAADLRDRVLRAVGDARQRFAEDHLRVLRALRFASRFGLSVETVTWGALRDDTVHLGVLSAERIREELLKVLDVDPVPSTALGLYREAGALAVLYPELDAWADGRDEEWRRTLATVDHLPKGRPFLRLAALLRPLEPRGVAQVLLRLRLSNAQVEETARRASAPVLPPPDASDAEFRRWLGRAGPERVAAVARLELAAARSAGSPDADRVVASWKRARAVLATRPPLTVRDLALDGRDLIAMGMRPGPEFGVILDGLLSWVLEDPTRNEPEALRAEALRLAGEGGRGV